MLSHVLLSKRKSYCLPTWPKASWMARVTSAWAIASGLGRRIYETDPWFSTAAGTAGWSAQYLWTAAGGC
jgi:hypothetical protein